MDTVPAATPVTMPEAEPTVAIAPLLENHAPPEIPSLSAVVPPTTTIVVPKIGVAAGLTVIVIVAIPVPTEYVIIHVPADMPVTTPVEEPTVAIAELLLVQCPPDVESASVVVEPTQTLAVPLML